MEAKGRHRLTKDRLKAYGHLVSEQRQLANQVAELKLAMAAPRVPAMTGMPRTPAQGSEVEQLMGRYEALLKRYDRKLCQLLAEQTAIEDAIERLDPVARQLMRYRYIQGMKWEDICLTMGYSWRRIHQLHHHALASLERMA